MKKSSTEGGLAANPRGSNFLTAQQQPIVHQPTANRGDLLTVSAQVSASNPSLDVLMHVGHLRLFQKSRFVIGRNKFTICTGSGEEILRSREESDGWTTECCGKDRPFDVFISNIQNREIIHVHRPYDCDCCCSDWSGCEVLVHSPLGVLIGYVKQQVTVLGSKFTIKNASRTNLLTISGPTITASFGNDVTFKLKNNGVEVGAIVKKWSGVVQETLTGADNYWITFPTDLDVKLKALILAACFLIDLVHYDSSGADKILDD
ncbi:hypothetical protein DMENIID0001_169220 [Sergentomyia squamirostris]